jgi:hypothetical protein
MAKSTLLYTVHRGRLCQNRRVHLVHPQYLHWPRLLVWCCLSSMTTPASSRTACSSISAGSTVASPRSLSVNCSSCSKSSRFRVSQTLLTVPNVALRLCAPCAFHALSTPSVWRLPWRRPEPGNAGLVEAGGVVPGEGRQLGFSPALGPGDRLMAGEPG